MTTTQKNDFLKTTVLFIAMCAVSLIFLFPLLWMIASSFKPEELIFQDIKTWRAIVPVGVPFDQLLAPYSAVLERFNLFRGIFNSFLYAGGVVIGSLVVNSLAGYALARFKFPGRNLLVTIIIFIIIAPAETTIIPLFVVVNSLGLVDTLPGLFIPGIASVFSIFLFRQFFLDIPMELEEAGKMDGASPMSIFLKIIIPLSGPVFATVAILTFIGVWNDFLWPVLMLTDSSLYPIQVALNVLNNTDPVFTNQVMAALTIATIPMVLVYAFFQKYIVQSVATVGLK